MGRRAQRPQRLVPFQLCRDLHRAACEATGQHQHARAHRDFSHTASSEQQQRITSACSSRRRGRHSGEQTCRVLSSIGRCWRVQAGRASQDRGTRRHIQTRQSESVAHQVRTVVSGDREERTRRQSTTPLGLRLILCVRVCACMMCACCCVADVAGRPTSRGIPAF